MESREPQLVGAEDLGLAHVAVLEDDDGHFLGNATVLSPQIAVTSEEVVLAQDAAFLRLRLSPYFGRVSKLRVGDLQIDSENGFGVVSFSDFSGQVRLPDVFGIGPAPPRGMECRIVYYDTSQEEFFQLPGLVEDVGITGFRLALRWEVAAPISGCPVMSGDRILGIVVSGPVPASSLSGSSNPYPTSVDVLGMHAMAQSGVSSLLSGPRGGSVAVKPLPVGPRGPKFTPVSGVVTQGNSVSAPPDKRQAPAVREFTELFLRLSSSSKNAIARANQIRNALAQSRVHMEHLIYGL